MSGMYGFLDIYSQQVSEAASIPFDQAKYTLCLLFSTALGFLFVYLPSSPAARHTCSIVISSYLSFYLFGMDSLHMPGVSAAVYTIMLTLPRRYSHLVVFVFALGYLSACHIYRMYNDWMGWSLDFSGPQMIITLKLIMIAVNYSDGELCKQDTSNTKSLVLRDMPTPLEFFGYVMCYPTYLAGPVIEYETYIKFVGSEDISKDAVSRTTGVILRLLAFCAVAGVHVIGIAYYPLAPVFSPQFIEVPVLYRLWYAYLAAHAVTFKYYGGWFLSESACISCGLGYNGVDGKGNIKWDKCSNAKFLKIEFSENVKDFTDNWNIGVANFLKNYVYMRLLSAGVSQGWCTVITQILCAFWHGFYPSYFLMFLTLTGCVTAARGLRRGLRHHFTTTNDSGAEVGIYPRKYFYNFMGFLLMTIGIQYCMGMFNALSFEQWLVFCQNTVWIGHVGIAGLIALVWTLPKPPRRQR